MEAIIRRRLTSNEELCNLLAAFKQEPAIFYARAVDDMAGEQFYPQIILTAEKYNDAAHGLSGLLTVEIICSQEFSPTPIERLVKKNLEGVLFKAAEVFVLRWQKSEPFAEPAAERTPLIVGSLMTFEIYELPSGVTSTPDPIQALQIWAERWDDVVVVGLTDFGEIYEPTRERPAVWFSAESYKLNRQVNVTRFMDADINAHIFAPNVQSRREWLVALQTSIMFEKAIPLGDGSPMRLQTSDLNFTASEIQGQLRMSFEYGILERHQYAHPLNQIETRHAGKIKRYDRYLRRDDSCTR